MLLLRRHSIPLAVSDLVLRDIIDLRKNEKRNGCYVDNDELSVTPMIQGLVIGAIDEGGADVSKLYSHVVKGGTDRA